MKPYNVLLAAARELKLFLTPSRQTCVELPAGAVPLWSEEFFTWCFAKFNFADFPAPITYNRVLRQLDDDAKAQPRQTIQPSNLRTAATRNGYHIDFGSATVAITGKGWNVNDGFCLGLGGAGLDSGASVGPTFHRPATNHPLPLPTTSKGSLLDHLREAFAIEEEPAGKLGQWLELALRPDQPCPTLVLTGELRDEAAEAIRNLIDPSACALFPFPASRNQSAFTALYNRVLAFPLYGNMSEFKRSILKSLAKGTFAARLRQADHKQAALTEFLGRPVILAAGQAPAICANQITIEIKKCAQLPRQEVLTALFTRIARSLHDEKPGPERISFQARILTPQQLAGAQADAPIP